MIISYFFRQFFTRIWSFLQHWYVNSFRHISHASLSLLERLDRIFAVKITLRHLFEPLYQDYTVLGFILGFIFRSISVLIGSALYLLIFTIATVLYLAWAAIPLFVCYQILVAYLS